MNVLSRLFRNGNQGTLTQGGEGYGILSNWFLSGGARSDANEVVSHLTALQASALWACVTLIANKIALIPKHIYRITPQGREIALNHPLYDLVHSQPNPELTAFPFWVAAMMNLLLEGNIYIQLQRNGAGQVVAMWLRNSFRTTPDRLAGQLAYTTTDTADGAPLLVYAEDMIHIMGPTLDGWKGLNPIHFARQTLGLRLAMDRFGARLFANFATPSIAITVPEEVDPKTKALMREDWEKLQSGANAHRVAILDQGQKIETFSLTPEDAQYIATKQMNDREIARLYQVPPHMIGDLDRGIKSNVEQQSIDFLTNCLEPYIDNITSVLTAKLFSKQGRAAGKYVVKADTSRLTMADQATRQSYITNMIQNGVLSINEGRELEGRNPIGPEGDVHIVQLNQQTLEQLNAAEPDPKPVPDSSDDIIDAEEENSNPRAGSEYRRRVFYMPRLMSPAQRELHKE